MVSIHVWVRPHPEMVLSEVVGAEISLEIMSCVGSPLPDWRALQVEGCRAGQVAFSPITTHEECIDFWDGQASSAIWIPGIVPSSSRMRVVVAVGTPSSRPMVAGEAYALGRLDILRRRSTGPDACVGCNHGVCIGSPRVTLLQPAGRGDWHMDGFDWPLTWQSGASFAFDQRHGYSCGSGVCVVPTRSPTWGQIPAQHR
jgi:hypothetical protein